VKAVVPLTPKEQDDDAFEQPKTKIAAPKGGPPCRYPKVALPKVAPPKVAPPKVAPKVASAPGNFLPQKYTIPESVLKVFHAAVQDIEQRYPVNPIPRRLGLPKPNHPKNTKGQPAAAIPVPAAVISPNKSWADFPEGQDLSPDSAAAAAAAAEAAVLAAAAPLFAGAKVRDVFTVSESPPIKGQPLRTTQSPVQSIVDEEELNRDCDDYDTLNPSAVFAHESGMITPACADDVQFDLGVAASNPMTGWWDVFLNGKLGGGFLARSLFCSAHADATLPSAKKWNGPTSMTQKKVALADMRQSFLDWTEDAVIHEWVRTKLFHIVCTNPKTYGKLKVTQVFAKKSTYS
jgi:hypothetical protein